MDEPLTMKDLWPVLSLLANGVMALAIYSLRTTIKLAIAELKNELTGQYATKKELEAAETRLDEKIDIKRMIESNFDKTFKLIGDGRR